MILKRWIDKPRGKVLVVIGIPHRWSLLDTIMNMAANRSLSEEELVEESRSENTEKCEQM